MASTSNQTMYNIKLSSKSLSFSEPRDYSKDFPPPNSQNQSINIYDNDIYTDTDHTSILHQAYWDYGKGFFFGKVKGTLSITIMLIHTYQDQINLENSGQLMQAVPMDFERIYDKETRKEFRISVPDKYTNETINNSDWVHFDYKIRNEIKSVYAAPISDKHYIMVTFGYINNSSDESWKDKAKISVNNIMSSFEIK